MVSGDRVPPALVPLGNPVAVGHRRIDVDTLRSYIDEVSSL